MLNLIYESSAFKASPSVSECYLTNSVPFRTLASLLASFNYFEFQVGLLFNFQGAFALHILYAQQNISYHVCLTMSTTFLNSFLRI
jgi:hypothetical protein